MSHPLLARALRLATLAAFVAVQSSAPFGAVPVNAAGGATDDLAVSPRTIELLAGSEQQPVTGTMTITMTGPTPAQVSLSLADAAAAPNGGLAVAPVGSTTWSLERITTISPATLNYAPNGSTQTFTVSVTVTGIVARSPRAGFITTTVLEIVPTDNGGTTMAQGLVVNTPLVAAPSSSVNDPALISKAALSGSSLSAVPSRPWLAIDQVVPDLIPGLVNHGPMAATARIVNTGDTILRTETTFSFATIPFDIYLKNANDPGTELFHTQPTSGYALPGQGATITASSAQPSNGGGDDALPAIGIVRITATTSATVGGVAAPTLVQTDTVLVFPWKEALAAILVVLALFPVFSRLFGAAGRLVKAVVTAPFSALGRAGRRVVPQRPLSKEAPTQKRGGDVDEAAIAERLHNLGHDDAAEAEAQAAAEAAEAGWTPPAIGPDGHLAPIPYRSAKAAATSDAPASTQLTIGPGASAPAQALEPQAIPTFPQPARLLVGPCVPETGPNAGTGFFL